MHFVLLRAGSKDGTLKYRGSTLQDHDKGSRHLKHFDIVLHDALIYRLFKRTRIHLSADDEEEDDGPERMTGE